MTKDKLQIELSCLRHTPGAEFQLQLKVKEEIILLAEGQTAEYMFANIRDLWKKFPQFGYDLEVKPYDCDHIKEGKIVTLVKEEK